MPDDSQLRDKLFEGLQFTFSGPEITDALCNTEQLAKKYGAAEDDEAAIARCVSEAIELTLLENELQHQCPTD